MQFYDQFRLSEPKFKPMTDEEIQFLYAVEQKFVESPSVFAAFKENCLKTMNQFKALIKIFKRY